MCTLLLFLLCTLPYLLTNTSASKRRKEISAMSTAERVEQADVEAIWLTYPEAQRLTSLGRTTLWTLVSSGEIKAAHVGRAVRINRHSLLEYMESQVGDSGRQ
jgi:excisionase family DNA binding protein